ncbi:CBS domain-containing protein [Candidatus Synechococcus calcipolaris G9]|uniref:CBS domain-containing protein n=1 Tax=Candidatus Synechococcus calcipolaris G9 TaxID=1497997 RepID=A0ABT6EYF9_9SYNE|nr:CBS domain-containing protein [Candidatus Synechococcus calcipolaris]MDG2990852.1 CBS domain-containing protein [Candidatus Synechococcus calcipolaris G9]
MTTALVQDYMTPQPITVQEDAAIADAIKLMEDHQIRGLPVLDHQNTLVGLVSEADLIVRQAPLEPPLYLTFLGSVIYFESPESFHHHLKKTLGQQVKDVMSDRPFTIKATAPISEAAQLIVKHHISRLPVLDGENNLVGIITRHDLMRALHP